MSRLPQVSGRKVVKVMEKYGYFAVRQKGSHIRMHHRTEEYLTVPDHKVLGKGILRKILRQANMTPTDFIKKL